MSEIRTRIIVDGVDLGKIWIEDDGLISAQIDNDEFIQKLFELCKNGLVAGVSLTPNLIPAEEYNPAMRNQFENNVSMESETKTVELRGADGTVIGKGKTSIYGDLVQAELNMDGVRLLREHMWVYSMEEK